MQDSEQDAGTLRTLWWVFSILGVGIISLTSVIYVGVSAGIERNRQDIASILGTQQTYRERIVSLESQIAGYRDTITILRADLEYVKKRLDERRGMSAMP